MSVRTDVINLNVNVNGNKAQNELNNLRKRAADIKVEMQGLKKGTDEYISKAKELAKVNEDMANLKKQIGLTSLSQKELNQELTRLRAMKGSVVPFTKEFFDLQKQIEATEARLYDVKNGVQGFASFWSKVNDQVKQFGMLAAGYLGFQFLTSQFSSIINGAGKMSDELADVQAKTGMTKDEVDELNKSLREMDTRTSTSSLRGIAAVGGQMGVATEQIESFTAGIDKLNVVMGDEFNNNAEDVANTVAKVRNTFTDLKSDDIEGDLLKIGNAFTVMAQNGVATAPTTADIASRIGAAGQVYGMTAAQVFGLSASYQELNISTERGSTATVKLLQKISAAPDMFYQIAGSVDPSIKSLEDFTNLVNTDITKAFLLVAQGFASNKGNATAFAEQLADAEIGSAAIAEVLSKVGQNTNIVTDRMKLAGDALQNTSAITEQFSIKNNTFGATLDKLGKEFNALVTSSAVTNFLQGAVENTLEFIRWLKDLPQWLQENRTAIIAVTTVILAYNAAKLKSIAIATAKRLVTIAETVVDYAQIAAMYAAEAATKAYAFVKGVLTGQITLATAAQRLWNLALKANPIGLVITLVGALATAISYLSSRTKELTAQQKVQQEVASRVADGTAKEISQANILFKALQQKNLSREAEAGLLQKLINLNPQFLAGLNAQNIKTAEGQAILDAYITSLQKKAEAEAKSSLLSEKYAERDKAIATLKANNVFSSETSAQDISNYAAQATKESSSQKVFGFQLNKPVIAGVDLSKLNDTYNQIKILEADLSSFTTTEIKKTVDARKDGTVQTKTSLADLKAKLNELEKAYEEIDIADTKSLKANADRRKQLQRQIDELNGKASPEEKKQQKQFENLKKDAKEFAEEIEKLRRHVEIDARNVDDEELSRIEKKYADLLERAKKYSFDLLKIKGLEITEIERLFNKRLDVETDKMFSNQYEAGLNKITATSNSQRTIAAQNYALGIIDKEAYSKKIKQIDADEKQAQINLAKEYATNVKKAAQDVTAFTNQQNQQQTQNLVEETDKRREKTDEEKLGAAKLGVAATRPGTDANFSAQKNLLEVQFQLETQFLDKKSELYKQKQGELNAALADLDRQHYQQQIDNVMQYVDAFSNALGSMMQIANNREQRMLQREKTSNDAKKESYKKQLDSKLMSQAQYDLKIQEIDAAYEKKSREAQRAQAKRDKASALFNAIINTGAAVAKALPNLALSIAVGIIGGLQIASIASQPLPELARGRWVRTGDKHSAASRGIDAKIERDEAVMSANAMTDNTTYTVTGTTAQITSALNSRNGGASWATGAHLQPAWRKAQPAQINPNMVRMLAAGVFNSTKNAAAGEGGMEATNALLQQLLNETRANTEEIKNMKTKLHAVVSIKEYRKKEKEYDAAQKASSLNQ